MKDLEALIASKHISARRHPTEPLTIYNYTKMTQFDRVWNETTMTCRGLIRHDDGRTFARPYRKFFNFGEPDVVVPSSFVVMDKADGSLGITYREPSTGRVAIATRGSFESEQAIRATALWRERYAYVDVPDGQTWLFEIVGAWNRIVIRYDFDDLILHGCVDNATGASLPLPSAWPGRVIETFPSLSPDDLAAHVRDNAEGYVLREHPAPTDRPALHVKVKLAEYTRIHKLIGGATPRAIWEAISTGRDLKDLLSGMPDEFYKEAAATAQRMTTIVDDACRNARERFAAVLADTPDGDRKVRAIRIQQEAKEVQPMLFALLSQRPIEPIAWKKAEPHGPAKDDDV